MIQIEKQTKDDKEITTIGVSILPTGIKTSTISGAIVGFLFAGLPGVIVGGIIGEVTHVFNKARDH
ncbi:MAG: hypothetical protein FWE76_02525 [Symbiobacteriaceae bacterium]|nr:hypothetical protein [Symbiobacteriaceae bacterium]